MIPKESNYDQKFSAPNNFTVTSEDKTNKFEKVFNIFLSFWSEEGASIKVSVKFLDKNQFRLNQS